MRTLILPSVLFFAALLSCSSPGGPTPNCPGAHCACNSAGGGTNCICQRGNVCNYSVPTGILQCQSTTSCTAACQSDCTVICDTESTCDAQLGPRSTMRCAPNAMCSVQLSAGNEFRCLGAECEISAGGGAAIECTTTGGVAAQCGITCTGPCSATCDSTSTCTIRCTGESAPRAFFGAQVCT